MNYKVACLSSRLKQQTVSVMIDTQQSAKSASAIPNIGGAIDPLYWEKVM